MNNQTVVEKLASHVARLNGLDAERSKRIYRVLNDLSVKSVNALKNNEMNLFSFHTDRMRPLLSYITNNTVKISNHIMNEKVEQNVGEESLNKELQSFVPILTQNLKIVDEARKAIAAIPFNNEMFSSPDICNAYIDYFIPLVWDFEFDVAILLNLNDERFLDYLIERGQKRFFLIGSAPSDDIIQNRFKKFGTFICKHDDPSTIRDMFLTISGRPPGKFTAIDCGIEKHDPENLRKMINEAEQGRNANWHRFNTINRADEVRVLDNIHNLLKYDQTSVFHNRFKGIPGVIVSPGPSLEKSINTLKKIKGKAVIVCVLRALGTLLKNDIEPDIVIQIDPHNLKEIDVKTTEKSNLWQEWIEGNEMSKLKLFITSVYSPPENFDVEAEAVMWMSPFRSMDGDLPIDIFEYKRPGGSVAHSALDILIEFGCSSIALVGQDLAYSKDNQVYIKSAETEHNEDAKKTRFGYDIDVKGIDDEPVKTNNVFLNFSRLFSYFADGMVNSDITLYNCSHRGLFIEGFKHCSLEEFLKIECKQFMTKKIDDIFDYKEVNVIDHKISATKVVKFIDKNIALAKEISELISKIRVILMKDYSTDLVLSRFDKLQNKLIKKLKKNYFYTLSLQKDSYILQAGLRADSSLETQLGFHRDFIVSIEQVNERIKSSLIKQRNIFRKKLKLVEEEKLQNKIAS